MWVYDPVTLETLDVNASAVRLFGWGRDDFLAEGWQVLCIPEDAQASRKRASASERLASGDWRFAARDGRIVHAALTCHPTTHAGRTARLVIAADVTEQRRAERNLRASEERFRLLVEGSTDSVTILDADGSVRYANPATRRLVGLEDPLPTSGSDGWAERLVHPEDRGRVLDYIARACRSAGVAETLQYRFRHVDGSWGQLETIANNLLDDARLRGVVLITRDITERPQVIESPAVTPVLSDLLVEAVDADLARGWEAGLERASRYEVIVTRLDGPGFHLAEPVLLAAARTCGALPGGLCGAFGAFGVVILPSGLDVEPNATVAAGLLAELSRRLETSDLRVAVGGARHAARGIQWSFEEAVRLLSLADRLGIDGLVTPRRAVLPLILDSSPRTAVSLLKVLQPLLDADQRSRADLVETLRCYLANDASVHRAADQLHVHRNTIRSRLRTIEKALGSPVADDKVVLQMALLAHELAGSSSSDDARDVMQGGPVE